MKFGTFLQEKCLQSKYWLVFLILAFARSEVLYNLFGFIGQALASETFLLFTSAALFMGWIVAVFVGGQYMPTISVRHSFSQLFCENPRMAQNRLDVLDVFRVFAICWVVANHLGSEGRVDILERSQSSFAFKQSIHNNPIFGPFLGNSALGVEIFLVLSGLLATRSWNRKTLSLPFGKRYFVFVICRWARIMPTVAVFVFLVASPLTKSLLPRFHSTMIESCGTSGILSHLTFTSNFASTPTCLGYLWYLGLDMQLYLFAPFIIVLLNFRARVGILLCLFLISASAFLRALQCQIYDVCNKSDADIPFISFPGENDVIQIKKIYAGIWEIYSRPPTKCGSFIIGLLIGQFLNNLKLYFNFSSTQFLIIFGGALTTAIATIYAILPEYWYPDQGNTVYNTLYTALFQTVFAGAIALMILLLYFKKNRSKVNYYWAVLAKLTFNVYLIHMPVVYLFNHVEFYQQSNGVLGLLTMLPFSILLSFLLALLFYCFVEAPLSVISSKIICQYI